MSEKSEHIIRREHYVAGREDERERIIALLWDWGMENLTCQSQYEDLVARIEAKEDSPPPSLPPELQAALDRITIRK